MSQHLIVTQGKVTNTNDPAKAGRIKVALAELDGAEYPDWIDPVFMPGWIWLPENGDTVSIIMPDEEDLVEFSDEIRWFGQLYDQNNPHPADFGPNYPQMRGFKTKAGHLLIVDDKDKTVALTTAAGHLLDLNGNGDIVVTNGQSGSTITMKAGGDVEIDAGSANVTARCATFTAEAATKAHLSAPITELSDVSSEPVMLGTTVLGAFTALFTAWSSALALSSPPPVDPNYIAYKAAMTTAVTAIQGTLASWLSLKTKTG